MTMGWVGLTSFTRTATMMLCLIWSSIGLTSWRYERSLGGRGPKPNVVGMGKAEALVSDNNGRLLLGAYPPESASNIAVLAAKIGVPEVT